MNDVHRGPRKPVNVTMRGDLVRDACALARNMPGTVETSPADYVEAE